MTRLLSLVVVLAVLALATVARTDADSARATTGASDVRITQDATPGSYIRVDGIVDRLMQACSSGRRQQVEPTVAVDPHDPSVIAAGSIDNCRSAAEDDVRGWPGYYRSTDGGLTWTNSLIPGFPGDTSAAGVAAPTTHLCNNGFDPTAAFDVGGNLFYAFSCNKRTSGGAFEGQVSWSLMVAEYGDEGATYTRMVEVARGTPSSANGGLLHDKANIAIDQTNGPGAGNIYLTWTLFEGFDTTARVVLSRSSDGGRTFSRPTTVAAGPSLGVGADLAVGPSGVVYVTWRSFRSARGADGLNAVWLARSIDHGRSFDKPSLVASIDPYDSDLFSGNGEPHCGLLLPPCPSGLSFPRFFSFSAVAADEQGVHVVWAARRPDGQAKIFVRNSAQESSYADPPVQIDLVPVGHQWFPDVASAGGVLTMIFYDSRADPAYSPSRPAGNTSGGGNSGNVVDGWVARSSDGGQTWSEERATTAASNPNWTTFPVRTPEFNLAARPFMGDYTYVSAVPGRVWAVWGDARDIAPGVPSIFLPFFTCDFSAGFPPFNEGCFSQGGLDWNIYGRQLE